MTPPRDPDEVEQTLLPGAPAAAPPAPVRTPPRPAKPAPESADTPPHPAASDATVDVSASTTPPPADAGETLASVAPSASRPAAPVGHETNGEIEATLLPGAHSTGGAPGTLADAHADATGATS